MMQPDTAAETQPHADWAREDAERRRLLAYADPRSGSDRFFAEANRLEAQGLPAEAEVARQAGLARYTEIKAAHPWPDPIAGA